jgi:PPM family protein phosphatase
MVASGAMSDWLWIAISGALTLLLIYSWTRKPPAPPPSVPEPRRERSKPAKTRSSAAREDSTRAPKSGAEKASGIETDLVKLSYEEDDDVDPTKVGAGAAAKLTPVQVPTKRIVLDDDAVVEEPTQSGALILVTATAQTDKGLRRKRNEDALLALPDHGLYVVADGMGGYSGGEVASSLAVKTIAEAFRKRNFVGEPHATIPPRASELARAVQMANDAIREHAAANPELSGMGTTVCAALFSPNKQRLYAAHVGDSRLYRVREGELKQMTSDHTMKDYGVTGAGAAHLSRAVGVWPTVAVDVLLGKPRPKDLYLLCSDGLTKMVSDAQIMKIANSDASPAQIVEELIRAANARGGKDNITAIVIRVGAPAGGTA